VCNWTVKGHKDNPLTFSVWDFAGQDVYYTTHSFFLSHRALYLVVFDMTEPLESSRVEYWLKSVEARTKDSPVILVGTHADQEVSHYILF